MHQYQLTFIDLALKREALRFGNFALKSGRESPYFFNAGLFSDGEAHATLGRGYAAAVVHDVITAGTAVRDSLEIIRAAGAQPAGVALALDRQERGRGTTSAVQELEQQQGLQCVSIVTLAELIEALSRPPDGRARISAEQLTALRAYQQRYGAA